MLPRETCGARPPSSSSRLRPPICSPFCAGCTMRCNGADGGPAAVTDWGDGAAPPDLLLPIDLQVCLRSCSGPAVWEGHAPVCRFYPLHRGISGLTAGPWPHYAAQQDHQPIAGPGLPAGGRRSATRVHGPAGRHSTAYTINSRMASFQIMT